MGTFSKKYIIVIFMILISLMLLNRVTVIEGLGIFDVVIYEMVAPLMKIISYSENKVKKVWNGYINLVNVEKENERLRETLRILNQKNNHYAELLLENERLRKLLDLRAKLSYPSITSSIIGKVSSDWFRAIFCDKGSLQGVKKGMAVISPEGVVGRVVAVSPHMSKVLLITDPSSSIDAFVQRSRAKGMIEGGDNGHCYLKYLLRTDDVMVGDKVFTSGIGGIFPKGLYIGQVTKIFKKKYGLSQQVEVTPAMDFSKIEEVLILLKVPDVNLTP